MLASEKGNPLEGDFRDIGFGDVALLGEAFFFATDVVFEFARIGLDVAALAVRVSAIIAHMRLIKYTV